MSPQIQKCQNRENRPAESNEVWCDAFGESVGNEFPPRVERVVQGSPLIGDVLVVFDVLKVLFTQMHF